MFTSGSLSVLSGSAGAGVSVGPDAVLEMHRGAMTLFIDGRAVPFTAYKPTELPDDELFANTVDKTVPEMAKRGVHVHFVPVYFGWSGPGQYDFGGVDLRVRRVLAADPEGYCIIRIQAAAMSPAWWLEANPQGVLWFGAKREEQQDLSDEATKRRSDQGEEQLRLPRIPHQTGRCPSLASSFWEEAGVPALEALAKHVREQDYGARVVGYLPSAYNSNEWFVRSYDTRQVSDLSPAMRKAFRAHLEQLAERAVDKDVPDRYERGEGDYGYLLEPDPLRAKFPTVEYYRFVNTLCAAAIIKVTRALREAHWPRRILVGAFYGYSHGLANFCWLPDSGHLALGRLLEKDGPDFVCSPLDYFSRNAREEPGGGFCWGQGTAPDSTRLAGKAFFGEDDTVPHDYGDPRGCWSSTRDWGEDRELLRRNFAFTLCKGQFQWWYDLHGHWWEAPSRLEAVAECAAIAKEALERDRRGLSQVAVVVDERASWHLTLDERLQRAMMWENFFHSFGQIGAPVDLLLLSDLPRADMKRYRAVFFPSLVSLNDEERRQIEALKGEGRSLVFYQVGGMINPDAAPSFGAEHVSALLGIQVGNAATLFQMRVTTGEGHALLAGCENRAFGVHTEKLVNPYVADEEAVALGFYNGRGPVGLAMKDFGGWRSFYCAVPNLPYTLVHNIVRAAGVHTYSEAGDVCYANESYVALFAKTAGEKVIRLPEARKVRELFSGEVVAREATQGFIWHTKARCCYLFELTRDES